MMLYIFSYLHELTENYHDGGGAVVIAPDIAEAINQLPEATRVQANNQWADGRVRAFHLDKMHDVMHPEVFIFEDAGCC